MRLNSSRMAVAALALGPNIALAPFHSEPIPYAWSADRRKVSREVLVAFDVAKKKQALGTAEGGRTGEVRFLGDADKSS